MSAGVLRGVLSVAMLVVAAGSLAGQSPTPPVPRPFPGAGTAPQPARQGPAEPPPSAPEPVVSSPLEAPAPAASPAGPDLGGVPLYPTADYLETYDAGRGQQYHLYGTTQTFDAIVAYYKNVLRNGGRDIYPGLQQFELGKFDDDRMSYPPSIVVRDYARGGSEGYLHIAGTRSIRYPTVIQIVPPPPGDRR